MWRPYLSERQWGTVREDYSPLQPRRVERESACTAQSKPATEKKIILAASGS